MTQVGGRYKEYSQGIAAVNIQKDQYHTDTHILNMSALISRLPNTEDHMVQVSLVGIH